MTVLIPVALAQTLDGTHFGIETDFQRPNPSLGMLVRKDVVFREGARAKLSPTHRHVDPMADHRSQSRNSELDSKDVLLRVAVVEL